MILDERAEFCDATSAILNNTNAIIGDVIDTQVGTANTLTNIATRDTVYLVIQVTTSFVGGTSAQFELRSDSVAALTTSATSHYSTGAIAIASLVAQTALVTGFQKVVRLPEEVTYEKYIGIWETTVGNVTAGAINAFLTTDAARWAPYADAVA